MPLTRLELQRACSARSVLARLRRACVVCALAVSALGWCREGVAEESVAERSFREGRALLVQGRFTQACSKLEQSQRLEPRLGTKLNIAFCQERLGQLATAWLSFQEAASLARSAGDGERERFARSRVDALEPRLPRLSVRAAARANAEPPALLLDGVPLPAKAEREALPVDPGEHVLVALQSGEEYWRATVRLGESEHGAITVPAPPATSTSRATSPESSRGEGRTAGFFVYELGVFLAYLDLATSDVAPAERLARLQVTEGGQTFSCASNPCEYQFFGSSSGFVAGVAGFLGHALTGDVELGLRFLLGPRAGGGALIALGPSMSFLIAERYRVSPTVFFGSASYSDRGNAELGAPMRTYDIDARVSSSLGFAMGLGTELGFTLTRSSLGSVVLQTTPLFLYGSNGLAWSLALGAAFRWN